MNQVPNQTSVKPSTTRDLDLGESKSPSTGFIDYFGYSSSCDGWFLGGWIPSDLCPKRLDPADVEASLSFRNKDLAGRANIVLINREDIKDLGSGFVLFLAAPPSQGVFLRAELRSSDGVFPLRMSPLGDLLRDPDILIRARSDLSFAEDSDALADFSHLLAHRSQSGETHSVPLKNVFCAVDEAIHCRGAGVVLIGWIFDPRRDIERMVLRCGERRAAIDLAALVRMSRPDVASGFVERYGRVDELCGFISYVPIIADEDAVCAIEIRTISGGSAVQTVPEFNLSGMNAIHRILDSFSVRYAQVQRAFDHLGPAIVALNAERIANPPSVTKVLFGPERATPRVTVIVTIYGRIDFVEYQLALFDRNGLANTQLIYVLDDPLRQEEFLTLVDSVYQRFGLPFEVMLLSHNVGFARANNIGLARSRGEYICFLNSDIVPQHQDWIGRLADSLEQVADVGIVGPLLLFEDGTIQHVGMCFKPSREFGGWFFPEHMWKGRLPQASNLAPATAITGACMFMRRDEAEAIGGFDEIFVTGDFEDSDFCLRYVEHFQKRCVVDTGVHMYHLERQSQAPPSQRWRMNMTLFNAWQHQRRWGRIIAENTEQTTSE